MAHTKTLWSAVAVAFGISLLPMLSQAATISGSLNLTVDAGEMLGDLDAFQLDLNADGIDDYSFVSRVITDSSNGKTDWAALVQPLGSNGLLAGGVRLGANTEIGAASSFTTGEAFFVRTQFAGVTYFPGLWRQSNQAGTSGYLGLAFDISGSTHYGWLEVDVPAEGVFFDNEISLLGYGYESVAGQSSFASQTAAPVPLPATAWLLGSALGLLGMRRRRRG